MDVLLLIGVVGLVLLVVGLVAGDAIDGLLDSIDLGGGVFSGPTIGGFLAAFGFGAAYLRDELGTTVAALVGLGLGLGIGALAFALTRALLARQTGRVHQGSDLVGRAGVVVSRVPAEGYGRVRVAADGHTYQLAARATEALEAGTEVAVVESSSATSVVVAPTGLPPLDPPSTPART